MINFKSMFVIIVFVFVTIAMVDTAKAQEHNFFEISQTADSMLPLDESNAITTQTALNTSNYPDKMDSLLNFIYKSILHDYKQDTSFIRAFKASQKVWLKYRDAELKAIMPPRAVDEPLGSGESYCWWQYSVSITKRRIEELLMWYNGTAHEGSMCSHSYWSSGEIKEIREKKK